MVPLSLRRRRQCRLAGQGGRPAAASPMGGQSQVGPAPRSHVQLQRAGLVRRPHLLHLRRGAHLRDPTAPQVVAHCPRRVQRLPPLETATGEMAHASLAAEERAGAVAPPPGRRWRYRLRDPGPGRAAFGPGRRHRRNDPHLPREQGHRGGDLFGRRAVSGVGRASHRAALVDAKAVWCHRGDPRRARPVGVERSPACNRGRRGGHRQGALEETGHGRAANPLRRPSTRAVPRRQAYRLSRPGGRGGTLGLGADRSCRADSLVVRPHAGRL